MAANKLPSDAVTAWQDYLAALQAMLPREEVLKLVDSQRARHFATWQEVVGLRARLKHRKVTPNDLYMQW